MRARKQHAPATWRGGATTRRDTLPSWGALRCRTPRLAPPVYSLLAAAAGPPTLARSRAPVNPPHLHNLRPQHQISHVVDQVVSNSIALSALSSITGRLGGQSDKCFALKAARKPGSKLDRSTRAVEEQAPLLTRAGRITELVLREKEALPTSSQKA